MGSSPGFASTAPDKLARLRLAFAPAPPLKGLTTPGTVTRRIIMQKARGQAGPEARRPPTARRHGVSGSVSSPCRGSSHRSVALLGSLSDVIEYLALRDGPRRFRPGFTCPTLLGYRPEGPAASPTGLSPAPVPFSKRLRLTQAASRIVAGPTTPSAVRRRFRLVPVRSPLLRESRLISSPPGTEMFQFPGSSAGIPGSTLVEQLPRTYRSLPRPRPSDDA